MTLTAFNRARREAAARAEAEAQRRQVVTIKPAPVHVPTPEELAADVAESYAKGVRKLNKEQLVEAATARGVETAGLNKAQLVEALVTMGPPQEPADDIDEDGADDTAESDGGADNQQPQDLTDGAGEQSSPEGGSQGSE